MNSRPTEEWTDIGPAPDPRDVITPDAFAVAPELLGRPLARPWRRGVAMLTDLLLVAVLVNAGGLLFGLAAAAVFFRVSARTPGSGATRRGRRLVLRSAGALVLFITLVALWDEVEDRGEERVTRAVQSSKTGGGAKEIRSAAVLAMAVKALQDGDTPEQANSAAQRAAEGLRGTGLPPGEIREALIGMVEDMEDEHPLAHAALVGAAEAIPADSAAIARTDPADSLARAYAAALSADDSSAVATLRPQLVDAMAGDSLRALHGQIAAVASASDEDEEEGDEVGLLHLIRVVADELGIGFGWTGLYFTAFLALWRGQTPGKRVMGIRVIRPNGKPVGWWAAFERFGGYAAGLLTGLLGFAQIGWDRNRQAIHDKISETVVVWEGGHSGA